MSKTNGNALIYVLVAVVLLGILTYVIARSDSETPVSDRDEGIIEATTAQILGYASTVSSVYTQMEQTGTDLDELDLTLPSAGAFNTAPNNHKLFHPDGGGLGYRDDVNASYVDTSCNLVFVNRGWNVTKNVNWGWSTSASKDFFVNLVCVKQDFCKAINRKLTGSETIPASTFDINQVFAAGTSDFTIAGCAACEKYPSLCISANLGSGFKYVFYNLIKSR